MNEAFGHQRIDEAALLGVDPVDLPRAGARSAVEPAEQQRRGNDRELDHAMT